MPLRHRERTSVRHLHATCVGCGSAGENESHGVEHRVRIIYERVRKWRVRCGVTMSDTICVQLCAVHCGACVRATVGLCVCVDCDSRL